VPGVDDLIELGLVKKSSAFYSYSDLRLDGQGRENAREFLKHNLDVAHELETSIRQQMLASARGVEITGNGHAVSDDVETDLPPVSATRLPDRDG
jgi:recombination protein RecA